MFSLSHSSRVFLAMLAGLITGYLLVRIHGPWPQAMLASAHALGNLFLNAIRICVIPLVASGLVVGCASYGSLARFKAFGARTIGCMSLLLLMAALIALTVSIPAMRFIEVGLGAVAQSGFSISNIPAPQLAAASPLPELIPPNIFQAAAHDNILALIIFSTGFGLALSGTEEAKRRAVLSVFEGTLKALTSMIAFVLRFAPAGVFVLAVGLAPHLGSGAAGALLCYMAALAASCLIYTALVLYPVMRYFGRVRLPQFSMAALPLQTMAFASRSSLAVLPAVYEIADKELGLDEETRDLVVPFVAAVFRVGACIGQIVSALFLARMYGIQLGPQQIFSLGAMSMAVSLAVPGVPGGGVLMAVPVLHSTGIPVEGLGMLLAIDTIPDMFRTATNVTGWLSVVCVLTRAQRYGESSNKAAPSFSGASVVNDSQLG